MRPYVLLSAAASVDGYIDDSSSSRLVLSNAADLDRVDDVRAGADAILVGAGTIRRDNPRLLVRSPSRRSDREAGGRPASPLKVTLTASGNLDPAASFFTAGPAGKVVYATAAAAAGLQAKLGGLAAVVAAGDPLSLPTVLADLTARGVRRLMVEGGSSVQSQFLAAGLVDEIHLVIAPLWIADRAAPRFGGLPGGPLPSRMILAEVRTLGDVVLLRYLIQPAVAG